MGVILDPLNPNWLLTLPAWSCFDLGLILTFPCYLDWWLWDSKILCWCWAEDLLAPGMLESRLECHICMSFVGATMQKGMTLPRAVMWVTGKAGTRTQICWDLLESITFCHFLKMYGQVTFITMVLFAFPSNSWEIGRYYCECLMNEQTGCPQGCIAKKWQSLLYILEEILSERGMLRTRTQSCLALSPVLFLQNGPCPFQPLQFPRS